jgi:hypothetical protein
MPQKSVLTATQQAAILVLPKTGPQQLFAESGKVINEKMRLYSQVDHAL